MRVIFSARDMQSFYEAVSRSCVGNVFMPEPSNIQHPIRQFKDTQPCREPDASTYHNQQIREGIIYRHNIYIYIHMFFIDTSTCTYMCMQIEATSRSEDEGRQCENSMQSSRKDG